MKCPNCGGTGKEYWNGNVFCNTGFECDKCNGTGEVEQTNEEWFCQLSTKEKAKVLRRRTYGNSENNETVEQGWVNWLKAKHEDYPPDIPSVPSWDKWLQGEKTKCEYCDGNSTECELVGRSECPKTPKTEQEYIQTCNTEQLAEFLHGIVIRAMQATWDGKKPDYPAYLSDWKMWLKQPHKENA